MNRRAYIYGEISHHTEPIVGWVRLSPASDSWKSFSRAINGVYGTVQDEGLEISRDEVKAIFIEHIIPVVKRWVDKHEIDHSAEVHDSYGILADKFSQH